MKTRFTTTLTVSAMAAALTLTGCANMTETQQDTAKGAAIGAGVGALLGVATGGSKRAGTGAVLGAGAGALGGYIWSQKMQEQKAAMERATAGTGVGVTQTADNRLKLDIPSDISFDVGRSAVKSNFAGVLNQFATTLNSNPGTQITIIGHTDSSGSDAINNPLSVDRANSARDYLIARGVGVTRFTTEGRGSREPVADNSTAEGRAMNRRVEIFVAEPATTAQR
ncbi:OmpA family protein [Hydrogenophaga sp.]|uniref:OmpA family protein n=1 Tax=Hydrogenophaga sp. TaxID=1904254 RepID=UPI0026038EBE|nr:OmpA family protein [Hydrogenophaga sp.]MDM7950100.1 OmpA family protein [Hydrogenophaga sp.]